jgi:hypothetical protein
MAENIESRLRVIDVAQTRSLFFRMRPSVDPVTTRNFSSVQYCRIRISQRFAILEIAETYVSRYGERRF